MEHLFKLKKDGKTVGLMKIADGAVWTTVTVLDINHKLVGFDPSWDSAWCIPSDTGELKPSIDFDTAHPFVTKDKNGKDVFCDDRVWFHWKGKKTEGKIIKEGLFWKYQSAEKYSRTFCKFDLLHIELIEDKEDE